MKKEKCPKIKAKALEMQRALEHGDKVCLMRKALYGLKQAGRSWHIKLDDILKKYGLASSGADPCVYYRGQGEEILLALVYVDDILIASRHLDKINDLKDHLKSVFEVKDLGNVKCCLGIEFERSQNTTKLHQRGYIDSILSRYGMSDCKPVSTPLELNTKLRKNEKDPVEDSEKLPFRELIGSLMYLATATRPDIAHAVSVLSQFNNCYDRTHWNSAKRILRYLKGTSDLGLVYKASEEQVKGYVDADWANCPENRRSFTGYCFVLAGAAFSWESKKQKTVALSSVEAEYMGLSEAAKASVYLRRFLTELGFGGLANVTLYCDNQGAIRLAKNPIYHNRTKHIDVRHHLVRNALDAAEFSLEYLPSDEMVADMLTKGVPGPKHVRLSNSLGLSAISG